MLPLPSYPCQLAGKEVKRDLAREKKLERKHNLIDCLKHSKKQVKMEAKEGQQLLHLHFSGKDLPNQYLGTVANTSFAVLYSFDTAKNVYTEAGRTVSESFLTPFHCFPHCSPEFLE